MNKLRFIDCCSGIGGFHVAICQAISSECVLAIEINRQARATYLDNFPETPIQEDLTKIDPKDVPDHDLFCAGLPCQSFSVAGKQGGFDDIRGTLFFNVIKILEEKKPPFVIIENVPGILTIEDGKVIDIIKEELGKLYNYISVLELNSVDFGLAQYRKRVFIVCTQKSFEFDHIKCKRVLPVKSILEENVDEKYFVNKPYIPANSRSQVNFNKPIYIGYFKRGQGYSIHSIFGPSTTLVSQGGGFGGKTGMYLIGNRVRKLTPREAARLQGFPESFILPKDTVAYRQLGNAVPINVVQEIVRQLFRRKNV